MKIAVPTDDGVHVARRFGRAAGFMVAEVLLGEVKDTETRANPFQAGIHEGHSARAGKGGGRKVRHRAITDLLADCRAVIASGIGEPMRSTLGQRGIEVVITSEELAERALALFALAALKDESRADPSEVSVYGAANQPRPCGDEFDG